MICEVVLFVDVSFNSLRSRRWFPSLCSANGAPGATGPVSATANLGDLVLSESGLLGQVGGAVLGVPVTIGGGALNAGVNGKSLAGTIVPTGVVQIGSNGASGVVAGGIAPTGAHLSASGGFTLVSGLLLIDERFQHADDQRSLSPLLRGSLVDMPTLMEVSEVTLWD